MQNDHRVCNLRNWRTGQIDTVTTNAVHTTRDAGSLGNFLILGYQKSSVAQTVHLARRISKADIRLEIHLSYSSV